MKSKSINTIILLSLIFNVTFLGSLGYRIMEKKKHQKARAERMDRGRREFNEWLGLTAEQQKRLEAIREEGGPPGYGTYCIDSSKYRSNTGGYTKGDRFSGIKRKRRTLRGTERAVSQNGRKKAWR